jgi:hypothetical protein
MSFTKVVDMKIDWKDYTFQMEWNDWQDYSDSELEVFYSISTISKLEDFIRTKLEANRCKDVVLEALKKRWELEKLVQDEIDTYLIAK